jgi:hypothetical protein
VLLSPPHKLKFREQDLLTVFLKRISLPPARFRIIINSKSEINLLRKRLLFRLLKRLTKLTRAKKLQNSGNSCEIKKKNSKRFVWRLTHRKRSNLNFLSLIFLKRLILR